MESSLVASGRVLGEAEAPSENALVGIDAMSAGKLGGEYECTGACVVGNWVAMTSADGRFAVTLALQSDGAPACVGDDAWRDAAFVVRPFTPVAAGVAPDTVRFELRVPR